MIINGNTYRPHKGNFNDFIETITFSLHKLLRSLTEHKLNLMSDFNLHLFNIGLDSRVVTCYFTS